MADVQHVVGAVSSIGKVALWRWGVLWRSIVPGSGVVWPLWRSSASYYRRFTSQLLLLRSSVYDGRRPSCVIRWEGKMVQVYF